MIKLRIYINPTERLHAQNRSYFMRLRAWSRRSSNQTGPIILEDNIPLTQKYSALSTAFGAAGVGRG